MKIVRAKCTVCGKEFSTRDRATNHVRFSTGGGHGERYEIGAEVEEIEGLESIEVKIENQESLSILEKLNRLYNIPHRNVVELAIRDPGRYLELRERTE